MVKKLIITEEHSTRNPKQKLEIELHGGSPWFADIWIDDECYIIHKGPRTVSIKKVS